MKGFWKNRLPGILITVLLTIALTLFMGILVKTNLLPNKLILLAGGVFLLFVLAVCLLTINSKRTGRMVAGCIMTVVVLAVLIIGTPYLTKAVDTLNKMTGVDVEIADIGVYAKTDSPLQSIADLSGKTVGIMEVLDRENSDKTVAELRGQVGELTVAQYADLGDLVDGLLQDETDAIVLNVAYLDLLAEMEGYENAAAQLREIHAHQTETIIESAQTAPTENSGWSIKDLLGGAKEEEEKDQVFTMYISGIDTYGRVSAKSRSDVNIIAVVNVDTRQVLLVSTPRDFYVPLPISNGSRDKLTHAGIYGVDVSMGTLEMLYGIELDYFFRVNFSGFKKIIDALGGVTVNSDYSFSDHSVGYYYFTKGENHLNGDQALAFARERYAFSDGDRQRGRNQMKVIEGVIQKAMSPAILTGYTDLMESIAGNFETSMPYDLIADLVKDQLDNGGSWNIVSTSVTGYDSSNYTYSAGVAYVMEPNQESVDAAIAMMEQVKNGEILG